MSRFTDIAIMITSQTLSIPGFILFLSAATSRPPGAAPRRGCALPPEGGKGVQGAGYDSIHNRL